MANRRRNKGNGSIQNDSGGVVTNQVGGLTNLVITESESRHNAEETIRNTNAEVQITNQMNFTFKLSKELPSHTYDIKLSLTLNFDLHLKFQELFEKYSNMISNITKATMFTF